MKLAFSKFSPTNFKFIKFHHLDHLYLVILWYGSIHNTSTRLNESFHIDFLKLHYKFTNRHKNFIQSLTYRVCNCLKTSGNDLIREVFRKQW